MILEGQMGVGDNIFRKLGNACIDVNFQKRISRL